MDSIEEINGPSVILFLLSHKMYTILDHSGDGCILASLVSLI